jgi:hypothetical protein
MPHVSTRSVGSPVDDDRLEADAIQAWTALRRHLEAKNRAINAEVAHYPTPIARCDVQLSKLLEQRARVYRELECIAQIGEIASSDRVGAEWLRGVDRFTANGEPDAEDDAEIALRIDLKRAIGGLRRFA